MSQINILLTVGFVLCVSGAYLVRSFWRKRHRQRESSCFIRCVTEEQCRKLEAANVPFGHAVIDDTAERGILFNATVLKKVLKILDGNVIFSWERHDGIKEYLVDWRLNKKSPLNEHKVKVIGRPSCDIGRLAGVVRNVLLPHVRRDIIIHAAPSGLHQQPAEDGCFHVFLHAASYDRGQVAHPENLLGLPDLRARNSRAWNSSRFGFPVIDKKTGFIVAELLGNDESVLDIHIDALNLPYPKRSSVSQVISRRVFPSGEDAGLGLLLRVLQQVVVDLDVEQYVNEAVAAARPHSLVPPSHDIPELDIRTQSLTGRPNRVVTLLAKQILGPVASNYAKTTCVIRHQGIPVPVEDERIYLFLQVGLASTAGLESPTHVWGHPVSSSSQQTYVPSLYGLPILDNQGQPVGEVVGRCIYAYYDLLGHGGRVETLLMARFLAEAAACLAEVQNGTADRKLALQFSDGCESLCQATLETLRNESQPNLHKKVASSRAGMQQAVVKLVRAERDLFRMERNMRDNLGQEFDAIVAIDKVVDVKVSSTSLIVTTETLYCTDPNSGIVHEIGAFDISIPLHNPYGDLMRWHNKTRRVTGGNGNMMAPHVNGEGKACLGNTTDVFPALLKQRQFAAVVETAIAFVESVNVSDAWGKYIANWPKADAERQTRHGS